MRGRTWLVLSCLVLLGVLFLAGFPARAYLTQRQQRQQVGTQVKALAAENGGLEARARQLQSDAEIERLARQHYDLARPGEEVYLIIPAPAQTALPANPAPAPSGGRRAATARAGPSWLRTPLHWIAEAI